jgi:thiamine monophosphate kinase
VLIDLSSDRLSPGAGLRAAARALHPFFGRTERGSRPEHAPALAWVLTGGEDHALAATFPPATALPAGWTVIGTVHAKRGGDWGGRPPGRQSQGVVVDGRPWAGSAGWDHFRA